MARYKVGDIIISNEYIAGITRGPWQIEHVLPNVQGTLYTIRLTSNNTTTDTINQYEIDNCWHRKFPKTR